MTCFIIKMENYIIKTKFDNDYVDIIIHTKCGKYITSSYISSYKLYKQELIELKDNLYNNIHYIITHENEKGFSIHKYNDLIDFSNSSSISHSYIIYTVTVRLKINKEIEKMLDEIIQNC